MKTAIVTGSSKGIGFETALAFGRKGYQVFATLRNPGNRSADLKAAVQKENLPVTILELDVDSDESVQQCFQTILESGNSVDVLVNNAGIERRGSIEELPISEFKAAMETNYFGALRCCKRVIAKMREQGHGCIINVTSIAGRFSGVPFAPYAASKHALEAASEVMAQELKPFNIRVAIVEPGVIDTQMARDIREVNQESIYPGIRRMASLYQASLSAPVSPTLVADKILEIAVEDSWILRHPVGPDALPFLEWRQGMTDEEWIDWHAADDDEWYAAVKSDFGMDIKR